jgi:hypothetical protein
MKQSQMMRVRVVGQSQCVHVCVCVCVCACTLHSVSSRPLLASAHAGMPARPLLANRADFGLVAAIARFRSTVGITALPPLSDEAHCDGPFSVDPELDAEGAVELDVKGMRRLLGGSRLPPPTTPAAASDCAFDCNLVFDAYFELGFDGAAAAAADAVDEAAVDAAAVARMNWSSFEAGKNFGAGPFMSAVCAALGGGGALTATLDAAGRALGATTNVDAVFSAGVAECAE